MAFYTFRVGTYARFIYLDGSKTFEQVAVESPLYPQAIKEYAAKNFYYIQIDGAFAKGYINETEYNETIALREAIISREDEVIPMASQTTTEI